jgi:hypothetical protein
MTRFALLAAAAMLLSVSAQAQPTPPEQAAPAQSPQAQPAPEQPPAPPAKPVLTTIGTYPGGGGQVIVAAYLDNDQRVGLLGVASVRRASVAFAKDEWGSLVDLLQQARAVRSATWQTVGTFKETGVKEPAQLTVAGGPGVQFVVTNPRGAFTVSVGKGDLARLDASLHKVALFLDGAAAEPDKPTASVRHHARRHRPAEFAPPGRCTGFWCR